jgi:thioredoxin-related protein
MKRLIFAVLAASLTISMFGFKPSGPKPVAKIQWISLDEAYKRSQKEPRKIYIDLYTAWCGWCKVMDKNTFANPDVVSFINKKYYAVKYNPEVDADVQLGNKTFKTLMQGNVNGYPTSMFLDEKGNLIQSISSYLEPKVFHQISVYFGDNHNQKEPFDAFSTGTYTKYTKPIAAATKVQ